MNDRLQSHLLLPNLELNEEPIEARSIVEAYHGGIDPAELESHGFSWDQVLDFSSNILPHGPSPQVKFAARNCDLAAYPDRNCTQLRGTISTRLGIDTERILVGNGSSELIHLITRALISPGDNVLVIGPTFSEYERASRLAAANMILYRSSEWDKFAVEEEQITEQIESKPVKMVWLCNPNNPTGQVIEREVILDWIRNNPETIFVVDESYIELCTHAANLSLCHEDEPNLIVMRSMTKSFGMAGVRLGYVVLSSSLHRLLSSQRVPWSVSSVAQAAGIAALQDDEYYQRAIAETLAATSQLTSQLAAIGLVSIPSRTNYFLLPVGDAHRVRASLLKEGLLVRDCGSFGLPEYIRIASQDDERNRRLVEALARSVGRRDENALEEVLSSSRSQVVESGTHVVDKVVANPVQDSYWNDEFRQRLDQLFRLRRDVRHFKTDAIPADAIERWINAACLAPSVGLSQPWRFVSVKSRSRREKVEQEFETQNLAASENYNETMSSRYRQLKLAGLREAPEHLAVFVDSDPEQGHGLGRQTMPESVAYSVVAAIQNLWLAARSEGVGVGWVSILRPEALNLILGVPPHWRLVAYLCIGYPANADTSTPELESSGWEKRTPWEQQWHQR